MTSSCFLCGGHIRRQLAFNPVAMTPANAATLKSLRKSWSKSLCTLLGVKTEKIRNDLKNVPFCFTCHELIAEVDFMINTIARLEVKVHKVKSEVNDLLSQRHRKRDTGHRRLIKEILTPKTTDEKPLNIRVKCELVENSPHDFNTEEIETEMAISDCEIQIGPDSNPDSKIVKAENVPKRSRPRSSASRSPRRRIRPRSSAPMKRLPASYPCPKCPEVIVGALALRKHLRSHPAPPPATTPTLPACKFCSKRFLTPEEVKGHELLHEVIPAGSNPFSCVLCPAQLTNTYYLQKHVVEAHEPAPTAPKFDCDVCPQSFKSPDHLRRHRMRTHLIGITKMLSCAQCPFQALFPSMIRTHSLIHGEKNFKCDFEGCTARYFNKKALKGHKARAHGVGGQIHGCTLCGRGFPTAEGLRRHQLHHSTLRPFMCELCSATFKTRRNLSTHVNVHAENKATGTNLKLQKPRKNRLADLRVQNKVEVLPFEIVGL